MNERLVRVLPYLLSAIGSIGAVYVYLFVTGLLASSSSSVALLSLINEHMRGGVFVLTAIEIGAAALLAIMVAWAILDCVRRLWPAAGSAPLYLYGTLTIIVWFYWSARANHGIAEVSGPSSLLFDLVTCLPLVLVPMMLAIWSTRPRTRRTNK